MKEKWSRDTSTSIKAEGLRHSLQAGCNIYCNTVSLIVLLNGLDPLKGLSAKLQKRDADVVSAYAFIDTAIDNVTEVRSTFDSVWAQWFENAESIAANIGSFIDQPRKSRYQRNRANTPADTARYALI